MIAVLAVLALAAVDTAQDRPPPPGTELWNGAKVGMTPAQVQAIFPAAQVVHNGEALLDNAKQRLMLTGVRQPTGETATVGFYFRDESLNEVNIISNVPPGQTEANVKHAEAIAHYLAPRFGKPTTCGTREGLLAFECDWLKNGVSASVTYMDVAGQSPFLETAIRAIVDTDVTPSHAPAPKGSPAARRQGELGEQPPLRGEASPR
jgi:hypothetical protein